MKNYYTIFNNIVAFENNKFQEIESDYLIYDRLFIVPEDGVLDGKEVHAGDIVMTFYGTDMNGNKFFIFDKDSTFADILKKNRERKYENMKECVPCSDVCSDPN